MLWSLSVFRKASWCVEDEDNLNLNQQQTFNFEHDYMKTSGFTERIASVKCEDLWDFFRKDSV